MKHLLAVKATLLDDDAFRLLALPFGGPIPYPGAPRGADYDRQWFSETTDFALQNVKAVPVTWHHALESDEVIGKAVDPEEDEDGVWVKVWLDHGLKRVRAIRRLAEAAMNHPDPDVGIFGSSEATNGRLRAGKAVLPWRRDIPGEIVRWHYVGQTLSSSPQNTVSMLQPLKATLSDLRDGEVEPTAAFFSDLSRFLDNLGSDLPPTSELTGEAEAKAGRVLASRNEARLREAISEIEQDGWHPVRRKEALRKVAAVLDELDRYVNDKENP